MNSRISYFFLLLVLGLSFTAAGTKEGEQKNKQHSLNKVQGAPDVIS